jgi:anaerobic magnesium-protoporphyrin IX monomethyl ester cyclase
MVKIDLLYPSSVSGSENYSSEAPLGPVALYTSLPIKYRKHTRFLDSTILTQEAIEQEVLNRKANIIAISCTTYNYPNALKIASISKEFGATVIFGGIHITHLRDVILSKMKSGERPIDYLITGYGEPAFYLLIKAIENSEDLSEIPNLSFVKNGEIIVNKIKNNKFGDDPLHVPLDYTEIDFEKYSENFKPFGNIKDTKIPGSVFTQRGCAYTGNKKCTFCSIEHMNPKRSPELFKVDLKTLITKYRADHIRITDADFTIGISHMKRIANAALEVFIDTKKNPLFHCFARADEIDEPRIQILKQLNTVSVLIGYESGSDYMLNVMQKSTTQVINLEATKLLKKYGIDVICGGLVLGAEGENESTLRDTIDFVKKLKKINNTGSIMSTPLIPLPGSITFKRLLNKLKNVDKQKFIEISNTDIFDLEELIYLWNRYMCVVSVSRLLEISDEIENIFPSGIRLINLHKN